MLYLAAPLFTDLLGMKGEARGIAIHYLHVDSLCYFFTGFTLVGGSILRASGDTRTPMLIYVIVSVFNVFAAYSFVYGLGPLPGMGVSGIVIGTVCARVFGGLLMVGGYARGFRGLKLSLKQWTLRGETVSRILRIGIPAAADGALAWIGIFLFLMVVSRGTSGVSDDVSLAAHVVGVRIEALTYLPADAWGFAAAAMVGQALGAGDPNRARKSGHAAAFQCSVLALVMSVLYYVAAGPIYAFMHSNPQVVEVGIPAFKLLAVFQIPLVVGTIYVHALRGAGDTRYPLWINLFGIFVVRLPLAYLFRVVLKGGLFGAWIGMCSDLGIAGRTGVGPVRPRKMGQNSRIKAAARDYCCAVKWNANPPQKAGNRSSIARSARRRKRAHSTHCPASASRFRISMVPMTPIGGSKRNSARKKSSCYPRFSRRGSMPRKRWRRSTR